MRSDRCARTNACAARQFALRALERAAGEMVQELILAIGQSAVMCAWGRDAAAPENETVSLLRLRGEPISTEGAADRPWTAGGVLQADWRP